MISMIFWGNYSNSEHPIIQTLKEIRIIKCGTELGESSDYQMTNCQTDSIFLTMISLSLLEKAERRRRRLRCKGKNTGDTPPGKMLDSFF